MTAEEAKCNCATILYQKGWTILMHYLLTTSSIYGDIKRHPTKTSELQISNTFATCSCVAF
jgi:hypothetical protein